MGNICKRESGWRLFFFPTDSTAPLAICTVSTPDVLVLLLSSVLLLPFFSHCRNVYFAKISSNVGNEARENSNIPISSIKCPVHDNNNNKFPPPREGLVLVRNLPITGLLLSVGFVWKELEGYDKIGYLILIRSKEIKKRVERYMYLVR